MGQLYLQRFAYRGAIDKASFDKVWGVANETMAKTGNWGGVKKGLKHLRGFGTAFGGYALLEVDDPKALDEYQIYHTNNYAHMVHITFEPLADLDAALAPTLAAIRAKGKKKRAKSKGKK
jgi:hypothetical protein